MTKQELGTKRLCAHCGTRFYDLHQSPITCPKCETVFEVAPVHSRFASERVPAPEAKDEAQLPSGATPCIKIGFASRLDLANNYHRACSSSSSRGESQKFHQLGVTTKEMPNGARRESGSRSFVNEPVRGRAGYPVRFGGPPPHCGPRVSCCAHAAGDVVRGGPQPARTASRLSCPAP